MCNLLHSCRGGINVTNNDGDLVLLDGLGHRRVQAFDEVKRNAVRLVACAQEQHGDRQEEVRTIEGGEV